jgi:hypothetical protein
LATTEEYFIIKAFMKDFQATESIQYIVDRRRFDVDSDHDPDHKPIFTNMGKKKIFWLLFAALFYLSRQRQTCHNFQYFGVYIYIFWGEYSFA